MQQLTPEEQRTRRAFDWRVIQRMNGVCFGAVAYRSMDDLVKRRNAITSEADAEHAVVYRVRFDVRTLIGAGTFADSTEIGFNIGAREYPGGDPITWIISPHVPYSPHFKAGHPVCLGEDWRQAGGLMLLGSLLVHVARLLNWDEAARGGGYVGWNGTAIEYHRSHYGTSPLNPAMRYPALPTKITHPTADASNSPTQRSLFAPSTDMTSASGANATPSHSASAHLFKPSRM